MSTNKHRLITYQDILLLQCIKYIPQTTEYEKLEFLKFNENLLETSGEFIFKPFCEKLIPYKKYIDQMMKLEPEILESGIIFFYFPIFYSYVKGLYKSIDIEDFFKYTLLFMLGDNYMDNYDIDLKLLLDTCLYPKKRFELEKADTMEYNLLFDISEICEQLYDKYPGIDKVMKNIFVKQIESVKIQKNPNLDLDVYRRICQEKGNATNYPCYYMYHYHEMFDIEFTDFENIPDNNFGFVIQIIDDVIDMKSDRKNGITTYCSKLYDIEGSLDKLFDETVDIILNIKEDIYKPILLSTWIGTIHLVPQYFSETLIKKCEKYCLFPSGYDYRKLLHKHLLKHYLNC
jgi:hypothetical protein